MVHGKSSEGQVGAQMWPVAMRKLGQARVGTSIEITRGLYIGIGTIFHQVARQKQFLPYFIKTSHFNWILPLSFGPD